MKRKFVTNLILLLFLNLLIKPFWIFGIERTVQNVVGNESFGLYFALFSFSVILNIILDLGITNFNNRNIAQNNHLLTKHLSNIVGLKFLLSVFYALICLIVAAIIGYDKIQFHLLFFLIFNQFLISFTLYLRSNISALHLFRTDSLLSVLDRTLMIVIIGMLLFTKVVPIEFNIQVFVYAQTIAYVLSTLITFTIVLSKAKKFVLRFDLRFFLVILKQSYPYALLILLMSFYNRVDSIMLERMLPNPIGKEQAGIYAQAFRLNDAVSMFGLLFGGLLLPIFSKMIKDKEHVGQMVKLSFTLIFVPAIVIFISSAFYAHEIMNLLYHQSAHESASILGFLMAGFLGLVTTYIFGTLLTANGSLKQLNLMALSGMVLNICLNLILIPKIQALGSAYASMITQIYTALIQVIIAVTIFKLRINYQFIGHVLFYGALVLVAAIASRYIDNWVYGYFVLIGVSVLIAFVIRLINLRSLYEIIMFKS